MSRAARKPKTRSDLEKLSLVKLNAALAESRMRRDLVGTGRVAKNYQKEIDLIERVREKRFGEHHAEGEIVQKEFKDVLLHPERAKDETVSPKVMKKYLTEAYERARDTFFRRRDPRLRGRRPDNRAA